MRAAVNGPARRGLRTASRLALRTGTALIGAVLLGGPALAEGEIRGKQVDDGSVVDLAVAPNTEQGSVADAGQIPFMISVDGQVVDASGRPAAKSDRSPVPERQADRQRQADLDLNSVDIQIKFDGLETKPLLNVSTMPVRRAYAAGETVVFLATTNYPRFIERAEIRIHRLHEGVQVERPVATLPVDANGTAEWTMPEGDGVAEYSYVLRVLDAKGRFDETAPLTLARSSKTDRRPADAVAPGWGEDRTAIRNIQVHGGAVTIYGRSIPPGYSVEAFGERIPVDADRQFVVQRVLPPGEHEVDVAVNGPSKSGGLAFSREISIPENEWFHVALADLTLGKRMGDAGIEAVRPGEYEDIYMKGRLAFYVKGKIKGKYLLTAAADTAEEDLDQIFRNLGHQNPRHLLRKLDPDDYYPVYGDDSTMVEDAPTNGKFFVRLERDDSHVLWGNFKTRITGSEFMRAERALYGANATYMSPESTQFGERRTEATVYAAQPDTLPQREEFLGTGGSAYFLRRQNIVSGSESLSIEIRDRITGRVLERRSLRAGEDYRFDYLQGVVILTRPLSSATGTAGPVREGALGGAEAWLVAQYEFEPVATDLDGYSIGGRAQHWLNDRLRIGVSGVSETTGNSDQRAGGVDIRLRHSETTFLDAELAASRGEGFGLWRSTDGGLTLSGGSSTGRRDRTALAWRMQGQVDLADIPGSEMDGTVGGYFEERQAGFSTLHDHTDVARRIWGAHADVGLSEDWRLRLAYDDFQDADDQVKREGRASISHDIDETWKVSVGASYTDIHSPDAIRSGKTGRDGARLDAGVRIDYRLDEDHLYYAFGQGTVKRTGDIRRNDRAGVGAQIRLTEKLGAEGEVSYGTSGIGALAGLTYDPTADDHYYFGYRLDPDRAFDLERHRDLTGADRGVLVSGLKRRLDDSFSAYAESSYDLFGKRRDLTQTYGIIYTPAPRWSINAGLEVGQIRDETIDPATDRQRSDFERYAPSLAVAFKDEEQGITGSARGEVRIEDSEDGSRDQNTYLMALALAWQTSDDWRAIAHLDAVLSDTKSPVTSFQDTDYVEASLGFAYRPTGNDRLNALFKYSWLYDLPGNGQRVSGATQDLYAPAQRSHILSADFTYDLVPWLSVGGKYGFRTGDVKYRTDPDSAEYDSGWQHSSAHLGIARLDLHLIRKWDALLEARIMHMPEAGTTDLGALAALYRHVGNNFKLGVGYNFGRFSDDLRDLTLDDRGMFLNLVGKY